MPRSPLPPRPAADPTPPTPAVGHAADRGAGTAAPARLCAAPLPAAGGLGDPAGGHRGGHPPRGERAPARGDPHPPPHGGPRPPPGGGPPRGGAGPPPAPGPGPARGPRPAGPRWP